MKCYIAWIGSMMFIQCYKCRKSCQNPTILVPNAIPLSRCSFLLSVSFNFFFSFPFCSLVSAFFLFISLIPSSSLFHFNFSFSLVLAGYISCFPRLSSALFVSLPSTLSSFRSISSISDCFISHAHQHYHQQQQQYHQRLPKVFCF